MKARGGDGHIRHVPLAAKAASPATAVGWFGIWWFFAPHFDMRIDGVYSSNAAPGLPALGQGLSFLAQLHGYL